MKMIKVLDLDDDEYTNSGIVKYSDYSCMRLPEWSRVLMSPSTHTGNDIRYYILLDVDESVVAMYLGEILCV